MGSHLRAKLANELIVDLDRGLTRSDHQQELDSDLNLAHHEHPAVNLLQAPGIELRLAPCHVRNTKQLTPILTLTPSR